MPDTIKGEKVMKSPKHLSHKPLVSVNDYDKVDGMYRNNTDAKATSSKFGLDNTIATCII